LKSQKGQRGVKRKGQRSLYPRYKTRSNVVAIQADCFLPGQVSVDAQGLEGRVQPAYILSQLALEDIHVLT
jgi:hypothetical protein